MICFSTKILNLNDVLLLSRFMNNGVENGEVTALFGREIL